MRCGKLLCFLAGLVLVSCAGPDALKVKTFVLRDEQRSAGSNPWARMEKESRLRGAVTMEERRQRLGQYLTVLWSDADTGEGEVEVVFEYVQGKTGSRIKTRTEKFGAGETRGRASFAVIGDDYVRNGRVLAWQVRLLRGGREIASRRSYLWR